MIAKHSPRARTARPDGRSAVRGASSASEIDAPTAGAPGSPALVTLAAVDLAGSPEYRSLWFPAVDYEASLAESLPPGGFPSSMGYWLHPLDSGTGAPGAFILTVRDKPGEESPTVDAGVPARARHVLTLRLPDPAAEPLTLAIGGSSSAEVIASPEAWAEYGEAVLLVVAQYSRLRAIDNALVEMYAMFRAQEAQSAMPNLGRWLRQRQIIAGADAFGELVYDWSHFAGLYIDPAHYARSSRSIPAYRILADGLGMPGWRERLAETIEEIDSGYDGLLDKLFHYRMFALGMVVEFCIVVLVGAIFVAERAI
jgi:hypothetical protein